MAYRVGGNRHHITSLGLPEVGFADGEHDG